MLFSKNRFYRQAEQSDRHLLVNGPANLLADSRGVVRPFGLASPPAAPTAKVLDKSGALRRDFEYSYLYTYVDSYSNSESEPSPVTDFVGINDPGSYSLVEFGSTGGSVDFSVLRVSGKLEKEDGYYENKSIAVNVLNNDRKTEFSQWQYRKILKYTWHEAESYGEFTLSRPLVNVDADPSERNYEVKISDIDCEEGSVGGKSSGKQKLVLDPSASTDVGSYRLKVIRITAGKGKGQSRIIADACLNKDGFVEITLAKPWKTKPKYADISDPKVVAAQAEWASKKNVTTEFFNKWFSSEYVIYDPIRYSGLCIDGEISSFDKKTGLYTIDGLGNGSSILSGQVVRFSSKEVPDPLDPKSNVTVSTLVISLENSNTADDWIESEGLIDKTLRITSGPGSGATYVITSVEKSGENSISLTLSSLYSSVSLNGTPNASSTYVIFSADPLSSPDLVIGGYIGDTLQLPGLRLGSPGDTGDFSFDRKSGIGDTFSISLRGDLNTRFRAFYPSVSHLDISLPVTNTKNGTTQSFHSSTIEDGVFYGSDYVTLTVTTASSSPYEKSFKALMSDKLQNRSVGVLVLSETFETITSDPVDDPDDPGFKIYLSDLSLLGLDIDSYVSGSASLTFSVSVSSDNSDVKKTFRISRPILSIARASSDRPPYVVVSGNLPIFHDKDDDYTLVPVFSSLASVSGNSAMEGYYTGWKAFIYSPDNDSKPKLKYKEVRVSGYFDSTGSVLFDTNLSGVGAGWRVVLFSEYSRCLGSAIAPYDSDEFWAKNSTPIKYYSDFVPLEPFASSEDEDPETGSTPYEGWSLRVLSSSKRKKNGTYTYKSFSEKKTEKSKRTIVKYFPKSHRAYVFYKEDDSSSPSDESERFRPGLDGSEHLWLYDESSAIDHLFNEDDDSSASSEKTDSGCRVKISDIRPCPYPGVDKIRLYRASSFGGAYLWVATLDNKAQDFEDNTPEAHLGDEVDMANTVLPPCGVCCYYKGRFVLGGVPDGTSLSPSSDDNPVISPTPGSFYALYKFDPEKPIFDGYSYTDGSLFNGTVKKTVPALVSPFSPDITYSFPVTDNLRSEKINVSFIITKPASPGLLAYASQVVFSGRTRSYPVSDTPNTDVVYLPSTASTLPNAYLGCRFTFSFTSNSVTTSRSYLIDEGEYTPVSRCLDQIKISDIYNNPSATRYPSFPFTIDRIFWSIYLGEDGKYYYHDISSASDVEVVPTEISGPDGVSLLCFGVPVDQGNDLSSVEFHLGGSLDPLSSSSSASLLAFSFSDSNNNLIESYLPSSGKIRDERSSTGLVFSIPGLLANSVNASVVTSSSSIPFSRSSLTGNGEIWQLAIFDKYISPYSSPSGPISVFPKSSAYAVYVCSNLSEAKEKTQLSQVFQFADDLGPRITGLVPTNKYIAVFKERGIYALDPDAPGYLPLHREIGCVAPDTIATGRSGTYWLSSDRRVLRSDWDAKHTIYYGSKEIQPWLDEEVPIDGEWIDISRISESKATYDSDFDEYMIAFPTKSGKWLFFAFSDTTQFWFRIFDHSGTDENCSENAFNCLFKNHGRASFATDYGVYSYSEGTRPSFYPWRYSSSYLTHTNSGMRKLIKRIQIINRIDNRLPSDPVPSAYFELFRDLTDTPEESYQQEGRYTRRFFDTNKYVQYVHVGVRSLMWNFIMSSADQDKVSNANFVRINDLVLHFRAKHDDEPRWADTPYTDPPVRTT